MSKLIKISLIIIFATGLSAALAKLRKIPAPTISIDSENLIEAGSKLSIKGNGFIKDFNKAHRVLIKKRNSKKKFRLQTSSSSQKEIEIIIPQNISYGDYDLYIFLKTKFFKSKKQKLKNFIKIRPKAPTKPKLKFQVIKNKDELIDIIDQEQGHELILNLKELKEGINTLTSFYYEDGYKSLSSEAVSVYFLEESQFKPELEINSQKPLQSFAENLSQEKLDVSELTQEKQIGLTKTYHLMTPSDNLYLAKQIKLSPVYIKEAHVKSPEYLIIKNRDTKDFSLSNCHIDDELTTRYHFEKFETLRTQNEFKVEGKLSLNDTGDTISLICDDQIIDTLEYNKANIDGFASSN